MGLLVSFPFLVKGVPMSSATTGSRLLTYKDVADRLCVSPHTVRYWVKNGTLPSVRLSSRTVRIDAATLERHLERQKQGACDG
jgi:excisionase family DNA binding protein